VIFNKCINDGRSLLYYTQLSLVLADFPSSDLLKQFREGMHSPFFWRRNPTKTLGFLLPWFSPWFFVGFLLSPPPYAQSFLRKPSFLALADFFPWFFKSKQLLGFLGVVYMLQ
jgi:hypothetical protein